MLGQVAVDEQSNKVTASPKLDLLTLKGRVITTDALNCQRDIARQSVACGGDYVLALALEGTLYDNVRTFLDDPLLKAETTIHIDGGHGRVEVPGATVTTEIAWLQEAQAMTLHLKAISEQVASCGSNSSLRAVPIKLFFLNGLSSPHSKMHHRHRTWLSALGRRFPGGDGVTVCHCCTGLGEKFGEEGREYAEKEA